VEPAANVKMLRVERAELEARRIPWHVHWCRASDALGIQYRNARGSDATGRSTKCTAQLAPWCFLAKVLAKPA